MEIKKYYMTTEGNVRKDILDAALSAGKTGAHIAPSLSMVEIILTVLRKKREADRVILSKGHGAAGLYAAMHQLGMLSDEQFASFEQDGGDFPGQPGRSSTNGIDFSSGSLGMGLSYGAGLSYACRSRRSFVLLGDGELNEGSVWEAAALIARHNLVNVIAVVDQNGLQSDGKTEDVLGMDLEAVWRSFGWQVMTCDGHSLTELEACMEMAVNGGCARPAVILAETVKGKGVSFMEHNNEWHHHVLSRKEYDAAVQELEVRYGLC